MVIGKQTGEEVEFGFISAMASITISFISAVENNSTVFAITHVLKEKLTALSNYSFSVSLTFIGFSREGAVLLEERPYSSTHRSCSFVKLKDSVRV